MSEVFVIPLFSIKAHIRLDNGQPEIMRAEAKAWHDYDERMKKTILNYLLDEIVDMVGEAEEGDQK